MAPDGNVAETLVVHSSQIKRQ